MISMTCSCGGDFWVRDRLAGQSTECPSCGKTLAIPSMDSVEATMTPVRCACGETYWAATWRPGRRSKCPVCGRAVPPSPIASAASITTPPEELNPHRKLRSPSPSGSGVGAALAPTAGGSGSRELSPPTGSPARNPSRMPLLIGSVLGLAVLAAGALMLWQGRSTETRPGPGGIGGTSAPGTAGNTTAPGEEPDAVTATTDTNPATITAPTVATTPSSQPPQARMSILVPAYFYPGGAGLEHWDRLIAASTRVPILAVVNPASGPGTEASTDYAAVIRRAARAGVIVVGYVNTSYGERPRAEAEADIDRWYQFYPEIRGIFLDAQASQAARLDYYKALRDYVMAKDDRAEIVANPGTPCDEAYFSEEISDVTIVFENFQVFDQFRLPPFAGSYASRRFAALPYGIETAEAMVEAVRQSVLKGIGCVFITDGMRPNPWEGLPAYWDAEVEAIHRVNQHLAP